MNIEFDLKEYLEKHFDGIQEQFGVVNAQLKEIRSELKEHRQTENIVSKEIVKLQTHFKWLMGIGTAIAGLLVKQIFFP